MRNDVAQRDLKKVGTAAARLEKARVQLRDAIYQASLSGESVRDIAPWAKLSPTRIHELIREAKKLAAEKHSDVLPDGQPSP